MLVSCNTLRETLAHFDAQVLPSRVPVAFAASHRNCETMGTLLFLPNRTSIREGREMYVVYRSLYKSRLTRQLVFASIIRTLDIEPLLCGFFIFLWLHTRLICPVLDCPRN